MNLQKLNILEAKEKPRIHSLIGPKTSIWKHVLENVKFEIEV